MSPELTFGIVATILTMAKLAWIYWGHRKEDRATINPMPWMIWAVLGGFTLAPQLAEAGWQWTLLFTCANLAVNVLVVCFAIKHDFRRPNSEEKWMIFIALVGIVVWVWQQDALYGLLFSLVADCVGVWCIWRKAWDDPEHEMITTWVLGGFAAIAGLISSLYAGEKILPWYPAYVVINAFGSAAIVYGRRKKLRKARASTASTKA